MSLLDEMGLTPAQQMEVQGTDPAIVDAWLAAVAKARGLKSPAGYFLAGIRSGEPPGTLNDDRVRLARIRMLNLRHELPTEAEAIEELFGSHGDLRGRREDPLLVAEFVALWREGQRG